MIRRPSLLAAAMAIAALFQTSVTAQTAAAQIHAAGDPAKGEALFASNCGTCHTADKVSQDSTTLSLFGIVGRKAGANADFSYSPALQNSGVVWTPEKLNAYIENPAAVVPGNVMYFPGLPDASERADLVAYLATLK